MAWGNRGARSGQNPHLSHRSIDLKVKRCEGTNEFAVVGRDDLIVGLEQTSVDHTLHAVFEEVGLVNSLL
jgi:hypothetical protein